MKSNDLFLRVWPKTHTTLKVLAALQGRPMIAVLDELVQTASLYQDLQPQNEAILDLARKSGYIPERAFAAQS